MHVLLFALLAFAPPSSKPADPFAALRLFDGTWQVTRKGASKPEILINRCAVLGQFFACGQNVNEAPSGLVVFIPVNNEPDHYYTQTIMPEGRATGRDDLRIEGKRWTYTSRRDEYGTTTYYRTINDFSDKNHIHFERAESNNNKDWNVKNAGDEVRTSGGRSGR
jgi:hypothetical protein